MPKSCSLCDQPTSEDECIYLFRGNSICYSCCQSLWEVEPCDTQDQRGAQSDDQKARAEQESQGQFRRDLETANWSDAVILQRKLKTSMLIENAMLCMSRWDELQRRLAAKKNIWA